MTGVQTCALPICFPVTIGEGGGNTTAGSGAGGQATASGAGKQQLLHDRTTPIDIAQITVAAAQAKKLEAEADNLKADKVVKEQQILKLGEEAEKAKQETIKIKGEIALQGWAQRQLMTITDSELNRQSSERTGNPQTRRRSRKSKTRNC